MHKIAKKLIVSAVFCSGFLAPAAHAAQMDSLLVAVEGIKDGGKIPATNALCVPTSDGKSKPAEANTRPIIRWSGAPRATHSFAVFVIDPDVPADFSNAGKEGKTIAAEAKRQNFFHWGVVDIPRVVLELPGGKSDNPPSAGLELPNSLGAKNYVPRPGEFGGPCPPWNDQRLHHYHFVVLALDENAPVSDPSALDSADPANSANNAKQTYERLMASGHVVAKGEVVGTYTLNPHGAR